MSTTTKTGTVEKWSSTLFFLIVRGLILVALAALIFLIFKGYKDDRFMIQAFQVPSQFEAEGLNGTVVARRLRDEVDRFKRQLYLTKVDSISLQTSDAPDLQVDVMGVGLSVNSLTYHVKNLFGRTNNVITGELVDRNEQLELTLRMTGSYPWTQTIPYEETNASAFDSLLQLVATRIVQRTDPYRVAMYFVQEGRKQEARRLIVRQIELNREPEWAYLAWGELLETEGKPMQAEKKYNKALELEPDFPQAISAMAWNNLRNLRDNDAALLYFRKAQQLWPDNFGVYNGEAITLRRMGRYEESLEAYKRNMERDPDNYWGYTNLADIQVSQMKDTAAAIALWQQAAELAGESVNKYLVLALAAVHKNNKEGYVSYIEEGLLIEPDNPRLNNMLMHFYFDEKQYDKAGPYIEKLIASDPQRKWDAYSHKQNAYNLKAMIAYQEKEYEVANAAIDAGIAMDPNNLVMYTTKAEIYGVQGNWPKFYETMSNLVEAGFPLELLLEVEPYPQFLKQEQFRQMVREYFKQRDMQVPEEITGLMNAAI
ncbi:MAG: tetratricopeptide repeat protein [Bacteroidota bacterium]